MVSWERTEGVQKLSEGRFPHILSQEKIIPLEAQQEHRSMAAVSILGGKIWECVSERDELYFSGLENM